MYPKKGKKQQKKCEAYQSLTYLFEITPKVSTIKALNIKLIISIPKKCTKRHIISQCFCTVNSSVTERIQYSQSERGQSSGAPPHPSFQQAHVCVDYNDKPRLVGFHLLLFFFFFSDSKWIFFQFFSVTVPSRRIPEAVRVRSEETHPSL